VSAPLERVASVSKDSLFERAPSGASAIRWSSLHQHSLLSRFIPSSCLLLPFHFFFHSCYRTHPSITFTLFVPDVRAKVYEPQLTSKDIITAESCRGWGGQAQPLMQTPPRALQAARAKKAAGVCCYFKWFQPRLRSSILRVHSFMQ
jgi:hypothetical protein